MFFSRRAILEASIAASLIGLPGAAFPQQYPSRAVHLVVPYPAGGTFDAVARLLGERLTAGLGQPVLVENRPGASGMIALASVAKAEPDGYTLLVTGSSLVLNFASYKTVNYRLEDFAPVAGLIDMPLAIAVNPAFPAKTFAELVATIKASPDKYASSTAGTIEEIVLERLKKTAGLRFQLIPYSGRSAFNQRGGRRRGADDHHRCWCCPIHAQNRTAASPRRHRRPAAGRHARRADDHGAWVFGRRPVELGRRYRPAQNGSGNRAARVRRNSQGHAAAGCHREVGGAVFAGGSS